MLQNDRLIVEFLFDTSDNVLFGVEFFLPIWGLILGSFDEFLMNWDSANTHKIEKSTQFLS